MYRGRRGRGPVALGGSHLAEHVLEGLRFRHIATPDRPEVSGHYHPKARVPGTTAARPCFLADRDRVLLPAFGAYTGGLRATEPVLRDRMGTDAIAILTGRRAVAVPLAAL